MSAKSIQKKLDQAHKKVSTLLGYEYNIYRPLNNINVLHDSNIVKTVKLSVTLNDSFASTVSFGVPMWTAYTDSAFIQQGDYLYSEAQNRTFFILSKQPHLPVLALEVPDRIDIQTVSYVNNNGFGPTASTYIAKNVPCYLTMSASGYGAGVPSRTTGSAGRRSLKVITTFPEPQNLMGATILTGDFRGDIVMYNRSSVGCGIEFQVQEFDV